MRNMPFISYSLPPSKCDRFRTGSYISEKATAHQCCDVLCGVRNSRIVLCKAIDNLFKNCIRKGYQLGSAATPFGVENKKIFSNKVEITTREQSENYIYDFEKVIKRVANRRRRKLRVLMSL